MKPGPMICLILLAMATPSWAAPVSLRDCRIQVEPGRPAYVARAVQDLRRAISQLGGSEPELVEAGSASQEGPSRPLIEVRLQPPTATLPSSAFAAMSREAFSTTALLRDEPSGKRLVVSITATDDAGLNYGILDLIRRLRVHDRDVVIDAPLAIQRPPRLAIRGMYAHLHWSYHRPYALRAWELEDWKRYVDLLTCLGFNTIQIWPMMELLPHPLSAEDKAYLDRFAEIVHYAHEQRHMRVLIGSCPNSITEDARGVPISKREYFDFEKRLDPGDPASLQRILDYRSDLYKTVPDADGYWVIDSDPGGWKGSPPSQFVDILVGHQALIDQYCKRRSPLIYWMWYSWGSGTHEENWRATLADAKARLKKPWWLHACLPGHIEACRELGLLGKAIYFPYNLVETEPSGPLTELRFQQIAEAIQIAESNSLRGIQGNAQTPLAQLPNIMALAHAAWGGDPGADADQVLSGLAASLLNRDADVLKNAWQSLSAQDAERSLAYAAQLRNLAGDDAARGPLTAIIGDWQARVLDDLAAMLEIHAAAVRFASAVEKGGETRALADALAVYVKSAAVWLEHTGYHNVRVVDHEAYRHNVARAVGELAKRMGEQPMMQQIFDPAMASASKTHCPEICALIAESVLNKRQ